VHVVIFFGHRNGSSFLYVTLYFIVYFIHDEAVLVAGQQNAPHGKCEFQVSTTNICTMGWSWWL